ncbi:MAG: DUF2339 domain-containing protein [Paludibacteraceae bacterium]|nr:DUF2339 domain-containing protein [Paludibacteraceae bacterium]
MKNFENQIEELEKEIESLKEEQQTLVNAIQKNMEQLSSLSSSQMKFIWRINALQQKVEETKGLLATKENLLTESPNEGLQPEPAECEQPMAACAEVQTEQIEETVAAEPAMKQNVEEEKLDTVQPAVETVQMAEDSQVSCSQVTAEASAEANKIQYQTERKSDTYTRRVSPAKEEKSQMQQQLNNLGRNWEKFIGENLISKIGILVVMIGVFIGGKYAIDNDMVSPTARIIIGTLFGLGLQGVALKLKSKYDNFSAVLSSGSFAILYFMVYFAYDFYGLVSMPVAFALMLIVTSCIMFAAWKYEKEVIAVIGQVGAYVIPFLLSSGGGNVEVLLAYVAIINVGVLLVSCKKYWKLVLGLSFVASWGILSISYRFTEITETAQALGWLGFMFAYFVIFYVMFLLYKICKSQFFQQFDIAYILSNSFLFFGLGYNLVKGQADLAPYLEHFALLNSVAHFAVAALLYGKKVVDESLRLLILGLSILFFTLAIAICFSGHWITLFWMLEMVLLFAVGRIKQRFFYEQMSYPIMLLAIVSLLADWGNPHGTNFGPLNFLAETFAEWRRLWDPMPLSLEGNVSLPWLPTLAVVLLGGVMLFIDSRYKSAAQSEDESAVAALWSKVKFVAVGVVTAAALVHLKSPWFVIVWTVESALLFYMGRIKNIDYFKVSSFAVTALAILAVVVTWFSEPSVLQSFLSDAEQMGFWQSLNHVWIHYVAMSVSIIVLFLFVIHQWKKEELQNDGISCVVSIGNGFRIGLHEFRLIWSIFLLISSMVLSFDHERFWVELVLLTLVLLALFFLERKTKDISYKEILSLSVIGAFVVFLTYFVVTLIAREWSFSFYSSALFFCAGVLAMNYIKIRSHHKNIVLLPMLLAFSVYFTFMGAGIGLSLGLSNIVRTLALICYTLAYFALLTYIVKAVGLARLQSTSVMLLLLSIVVSLCIYVGLPNVKAAVVWRYLTFFVMLGCIFVYYKKRRTLVNVSPKTQDLSLILLVFAAGSIEVSSLFSKEAMSIYWGLLSVVLVYLGLMKDIKHVRISGIVIFAVTFAKIFFVDLSHLEAFAKAMVFVVMGLLLLVASFFYQKIAREKQVEEQGEDKEDVEK